MSLITPSCRLLWSSFIAFQRILLIFHGLVSCCSIDEAFDQTYKSALDIKKRPKHMTKTTLFICCVVQYCNPEQKVKPELGLPAVTQQAVM